MCGRLDDWAERMTVVKSTIIEDRPEWMTIREHRRIRTAANAAAGRYWHQYFLPKHWLPSAHFVYQHRPRSRKWRDKKKRMARFTAGIVDPRAGNTDNIYTGQMAKAAQRNATLAAYPTRCTITMIGPTYMVMRPYKANQPDKGAEATRVTPAEGRKIEEVNAEHYERAMNRLKAQKVTKL
jgi:hypothetical protein